MMDGGYEIGSGSSRIGSASDDEPMRQLSL